MSEPRMRQSGICGWVAFFSKADPHPNRVKHLRLPLGWMLEVEMWGGRLSSIDFCWESERYRQAQYDAEADRA